MTSTHPLLLIKVESDVFDFFPNSSSTDKLKIIS